MNVEQMKQLLADSDRAVERAIVVLYERQTADEQAINTTLAKNGIGFSAIDGEFLSGLAIRITVNAAHLKEGRKLSRAQLQIARRKLMKYAGQLVHAAELKAKAKVPEAPLTPYVPLPPVARAKPCFHVGCPNDRMEGSVLCAECAGDAAIVDATNELFLTGYLLSTGAK